MTSDTRMTHDTAPTTGDLAEIASTIREALTPLVNSVQVVRMVAGDNPRLATALGVIDRQTRRLGQVADEITGGDPAK
jgi:hypothetical protein